MQIADFFAFFQVQIRCHDWVTY